MLKARIDDQKQLCPTAFCINIVSGINFTEQDTACQAKEAFFTFSYAQIAEELSYLLTP